MGLRDPLRSTDRGQSRRGGTALAAAGLVLVAGLAACGGPRHTTSPEPAQGVAGRAVSRDRVRAVGWPRAAPRPFTTSGGTRVTITLTRGACDALRARRAGASASEVRIVVVDTDTSRGRPCTRQAVEQALRVRLQRPLGDRTLVLIYRRATA